MTARARRLDGELEIDSGEGRGTLLRLTVPCGGPGPVAPGRPRPSVLVAAVRPVVRAGVVRLLQLGAPELGMVSEIDLGTATHDLAEVCRLLGPDVLVVEPEVLADPATATSPAPSTGSPACPTPRPSSCSPPECPDDALRVAVTGGVKGCVGPDDGDRLVDTVAAAGRGETSFGPDQLGRLAAAPRTGGVTAREREVCRPRRPRAHRPADRLGPVDLGEDGREARRLAAAQDRRPEPDDAGRVRLARSGASGPIVRAAAVTLTSDGSTAPLLRSAERQQVAPHPDGRGQARRPG